MEPSEPRHEVAGFDQMLREELAQLRLRRAHVFKVGSVSPGQGDKNGAVDDAHAFGALGLGLSGGGIRSATFNLGILQGLASRGLLPCVDYLSTVSGGGYIGTWLHGIIKRQHAGDPVGAGKAIDPKLHNSETFSDPQQDPVAFLRMYSNYLAPRPGLFSADSWVILMIWLRNMLLNQLILIPALAAVILIAIFTSTGLSTWTPLQGTIGLYLGTASLLFFVLYAGANVRIIAAREFPHARRTLVRDNLPAWPAIVSVLICALTAFLGHWNPTSPWDEFRALFACFFFLFVLLQASGGFLECFSQRHPDRQVMGFGLLLLLPLIAAAATAVLVYGVLQLSSLTGYSQESTIWGPPLLMVALSSGASFHIGLMGSDFSDACREWLARIGAILTIFSFAWIVIAGLSLYGPLLLALLALKWGGVAVAAVVAWAGATFAGVKIGFGSKTSGAGQQPTENPVREIVAQAAPGIFVVGVLILLATGIHLMIAVAHNGGIGGWVNSYGTALAAPRQQRANSKYDGWFAFIEPFTHDYAGNLKKIAFFPVPICHTPACAQPNDSSLLPIEAIGVAVPSETVFLLLLILPAALLPLRFNINEFSMHHFYKNRLVRCYLGAGNTVHRKPNPLTGFDPADDFPINSLLPTDKNPYFGPYAIVNTALNTNVGAEMGRQERKATSFVFTPLRSGFAPPLTRRDQTRTRAVARLDPDGFRLTKGYIYPHGPDIGTTMGISGAAANPNDGYHTSSAVAFLLTWFDVRLGWWVGNPRVKSVRSSLGQSPGERPGPLYSIRWLFQELLAQTTARSNYVNLSDGGHFDNLGLYELVRRRCRYIVIGDGETDPDLTFESLGGAIRKCRADFDVEIDIDIDQIRAAAGSYSHCVVGRIIYPEAASTESGHEQRFTSRGPVEDGNARGWLLYLKASLTGDEPEDIKQFKVSNPAFPHDPTANQFFTESLFESYRRLGQHVAESAFENVQFEFSRASQENRPEAELARGMDSMFQTLAEVWYPPSTFQPGLLIKLADAYTVLINKLAADPDLQFLDREVNNGDSLSIDDFLPANNLKVRFFILEMIQLMENVWGDLHMESVSNRANPNNAGWIDVFQRWVKGNYFQTVWRAAKRDYNPLFQSFVDGLQK